ncbi:hypothetical protein M2347_001353 [Chryseobacterium sp. H1D6B]|nr:hypothetical protein [Chryseobacterium sp. H1D6B]
MQDAFLKSAIKDKSYSLNLPIFVSKTTVGRI